MIATSLRKQNSKLHVNNPNTRRCTWSLLAITAPCHPWQRSLLAILGFRDTRPSMASALISNVLFESWLQGHSAILGQRVPSISKARLNVPTFHVPRSTHPVPSPGRSVTRARRLYVSRLANSVKATPDAGQCTRSPLAILGSGDTRPSMVVGCALPPMRQGPLPPSLAPVTLDHPWSSDGAFGGHPAPQRQELERLVCSAS